MKIEYRTDEVGPPETLEADFIFIKDGLIWYADEIWRKTSSPEISVKGKQVLGVIKNWTNLKFVEIGPDVWPN